MEVKAVIARAKYDILQEMNRGASLEGAVQKVKKVWGFIQASNLDYTFIRAREEIMKEHDIGVTM